MFRHSHTLFLNYFRHALAEGSIHFIVQRCAAHRHVGRDIPHIEAGVGNMLADILLHLGRENTVTGAQFLLQGTDAAFAQPVYGEYGY